MKTTIPEALTADVPQTIWGKILSATPVVMTVVATMLAGLSSSEMTRAQYDRAYAAQLQAKAGDQWNYFQAKKLRGAIQRSSAELLRATADLAPLETRLRNANPDFQQSIVAMDQMLAAAADAPAVDPNVKAALDAVSGDKPDPEILALLKAVKEPSLAKALEIAKNRAREFDANLRAADPDFDSKVAALAAKDKALAQALTALRMEYQSRRYETEAKLNQAIANIYELQVRKNNMSAERHHARSQRFFFGMLAAQAAVIIATFALAAKKRNLLWSLAATAGVAAILFALYVYLYV
ncbi:MAG TPA: DUF4337 family protein [Candidatus Paceibacterota bacterium]|nr:DUF4337 family protein [Verrucomicrobiota bacterium]HRY51588.1 DUF4337 family protein [Candidatus Paceibacterota bacterium]HSA01808.1 DUF4337 family protein [Candidatus Paceibacterota bacterium]